MGVRGCVYVGEFGEFGAIPSRMRDSYDAPLPLFARLEDPAGMPFPCLVKWEDWDWGGGGYTVVEPGEIFDREAPWG